MRGGWQLPELIDPVLEIQHAASPTHYPLSASE